MLAALGAGLLPGARSRAAPVPDVRPDASRWAKVLRDYVDERGRVDFEAIRRDPQDLLATVAWIATTSPENLSGSERLAFLINAYNALAMQHVLDEGVPRRLSLLGRIWFFGITKVTVGGRRISLFNLENDVIRPIGDARVHFALNCMSVSCPRLPRTPFTAEELDRQLDDAARLFFSEPRNVRLDGDVVDFSAILHFYRADYLAHAPSLIGYANLWRTSPIPATERVRFFDYDWTINRQPPAD